MSDTNKMNEESLKNVSGGAGGYGYYATVVGTTYYLALRSEPNYNDANEIGQLPNGTRVNVIGSPTPGLSDGFTYVLVSVPALGGMQGYVNAGYIA